MITIIIYFTSSTSYNDWMDFDEFFSSNGRRNNVSKYVINLKWIDVIKLNSKCVFEFETKFLKTCHGIKVVVAVVLFA